MRGKVLYRRRPTRGSGTGLLPKRGTEHRQSQERGDFMQGAQVSRQCCLATRWKVHWFAQAAVARYHKLNCLKHIGSFSSGGQKSRVKVSAGQVSLEVSSWLVGGCLLPVSSQSCSCACLSPDLLVRHSYIRLGLTLMTSILLQLSKDPISK